MAGSYSKTRTKITSDTHRIKQHNGKHSVHCKHTGHVLSIALNTIRKHLEDTEYCGSTSPNITSHIKHLTEVYANQQLASIPFLLMRWKRSSNDIYCTHPSKYPRFGFMELLRGRIWRGRGGALVVAANSQIIKSQLYHHFTVKWSFHMAHMTGRQIKSSAIYLPPLSFRSRSERDAENSYSSILQKVCKQWTGRSSCI